MSSLKVPQLEVHLSLVVSVCGSFEGLTNMTSQPISLLDTADITPPELGSYTPGVLIGWLLNPKNGGIWWQVLLIFFTSCNHLVSPLVECMYFVFWGLLDVSKSPQGIHEIICNEMRLMGFFFLRCQKIMFLLKCHWDRLSWLCNYAAHGTAICL